MIVLCLCSTSPPFLLLCCFSFPSILSCPRALLPGPPSEGLVRIDELRLLGTLTDLAAASPDQAQKAALESPVVASSLSTRDQSPGVAEGSHDQAAASLSSVQGRRMEHSPRTAS